MSSGPRIAFGVRLKPADAEFLKEAAERMHLGSGRLAAVLVERALQDARRVSAEQGSQGLLRYFLQG